MIQRTLSTMLLLMSLVFGSLANEKTMVSPKGKEMKHSILVLYRATPQWLNLSREGRNTFYEQKVIPIIQRFDGKLSIRLFDSEAFHSKTSDFLFIECTELRDYYYFMEYLRDTALFGKPYIELNDVIMGIENGFQTFESNNEMNTEDE